MDHCGGRESVRARGRFEPTTCLSTVDLFICLIVFRWRSITDTDAVATENIEFYFTHLISKVMSVTKSLTYSLVLFEKVHVVFKCVIDPELY